MDRCEAVLDVNLEEGFTGSMSSRVRDARPAFDSTVDAVVELYALETPVEPVQDLPQTTLGCRVRPQLSLLVRLLMEPIMSPDPVKNPPQLVLSASKVIR